MNHGEFVDSALRMFPEPKAITTDTFEQARDRLFGLLREENKHMDPLSRWITACKVVYDLTRPPYYRDEPQRSWLVRILDEDLAKMLAALHSGGLGQDFNSAWPDRWCLPAGE